MTVEQAIKRDRDAIARWVSSLAPAVADIRASGAHTLHAIAMAMNARGLRTCRGSAWTEQSVWWLFTRLPPGQWRSQKQIRADWLQKIGPVIADIQRAGHTLPNVIANELNARGLTTMLGGRWRADKVWKALAQLAGQKEVTPWKQVRLAMRNDWMAGKARVVIAIRRLGLTSGPAVARELNRRRVATYQGRTWSPYQARELMKHVSPAVLGPDK